MSKVAIAKAEFHKLIDSINDLETLEKFYQLMASFYKDDSSIDILDELSETQRRRLYQSIAQAKAGETFSHENVKREVSKWLSK
ncbi:MAG: hypothetical protein SFW35_02875 [Chitinophagales bacterium]|nr:hypothetical protein [Chitinophagales bacterium]